MKNQIGIDEKIQFTDIFEIEEIQRMQDMFSAATGVASIITSPEGMPITKPSNFTRLCNDIIRQTPIGCANCIKSDAAIGGLNSKQIVVQKCLSAGLWDAGVPISVGNFHIANWLIGQVQTEGLDREKIIAYADEIGADKDEFLAALDEVPIMTESRFQKVAEMLLLYANEMSEKTYNNLRLKNEIAEREIANQKLQKSEESLAITLHSIGDGVISTDKAGFINSMNPVAEQLCGWTLAEAKGKQLTEVFNIVNAITRLSVENPVDKVLENGQIVGLANHTVLISRDKTEYQIADSAAPIKNKEGEIIGVVLVFSDVTEQYRLEELQKQSDLRYRNLLNHLETGVVVHAPDTSIISCNARATELLGLSEMEIFGKTAMHPDWKFLAENGADLALKDFPVNRIIADKNALTNYVIGIQRSTVNDVVWVMVNGFCVWNAKNELAEIVISFIDITQRKLADEALLKSRADFMELFNNAPVGYHELDNEGRIILINQTELDLLGYTNEEVIGKYGWQFLENQVESRKRLHAKLHGEVSISVNAERVFLRKDGSPIVFLLNDKIIKDQNGVITGIRTTFQDITKWKKTEKALQESEKRHRILFMESPDAYLILENGVFVDCNKETERLLRGSKAQIVGKSPSSLSPEYQRNAEDSIALASRYIEEALRYGKNTFEWMHSRFDGSELYVEVTLSAMILNGKQTFFTTWRDITKRKQAEDMLLNERQLLRTLIDNIPETIYSKDLKSRKILANKAEYEFLGGKKEQDILGKDDYEFFTDECAKSYIADDQLVFQSGVPLLDRDEYFIDKNGQKQWLLTSKIPLFDKNKEVIGLIGISRNITNRKQAEESLENERLLLRTLIDNMPDAIYIKDLEGRKTLSNIADVINMGANSESDLLGKTDLELLPYELAKGFFADDQMVLKSEIPILNREEYVIDEKGEKKWLLTSKLPLYNKNNEIVGLVGIGRDITIRRTAEHALRKNESFLKETQMIAKLGTYTFHLNDYTWESSDLLDTLFGITSSYNKSMQGWLDIIHPDWQNEMNDYLAVEVIGKRKKFDKVYKIVKQNTNNERWVHGIGELVYDENKEPISLIGTIQDITELKQTELELEKQLRLQQILMDISSEYINLPFDKIEDTINVSLRNLAEFIEADRAYIFDYNEETQLSCNTYEWCAAGIESKIANKKAIPLTKMINYIAHSKGEVVVIPNVSDLQDSNLKLWLQARNLKSIITIPMLINGDCVGFVGFDSLNKHHLYTENEEGLLMTYAQMLVNIHLRRAAEEALSKSEEKYRTIFENVQDVFFQLSLEGEVFEISPSIEKLYGYKREEIIGHNIADFYSGKIIKPFDLSVFDNELSVKDFELTVKNKQGEIKSILLNAQVICDALGNPNHIDGSIMDISKRKIAEEALFESQQKFKNILENSPFHIWAFDGEVYNYVNTAYFEFTGIEKHESMKLETWVSCVHPDDIDSAVKIWNDAWERKIEHDNFFRLRNKDGVYRDFWCHVVPIFNELNEFKHFQGFNIDITERKQADEALNKSQEELKKFAAHLQNVREEERIILAREIHDELGQILIAIKIDTGLLKQKTLKLVDNASYSEILTKFEALSGLVDNTINTARKIMTDLRPEVLYLLGFVEAVKLHTSKFQERYNIICNFTAEIPKLELNTQQSVALYRIVQEALTNTVKHAKATEVNIDVVLHDSNLILKISDNGIGIDRNMKVRTDSYGMIGMKERVFLLEGQLSIIGKPGKGTTIKVVMPYSETQNEIVTPSALGGIDSGEIH